jgi:FixJ family two-component response regulator
MPQKICLVDDDDAVRDSLRVLLESHGMTVEDYACAADFLSRAQANDSDCMLLDFHMPKMDGLELLAAMRARGSSLPVIILSGREDTQLSRRAAEAGAHALLHKPVHDGLLLETIRSALPRAA